MQSRPSGSGSGAPSRRLAAIAFVDIAAYTILMSRDETRTHQRWMRILNDVIRPQAEFFRGRIVKSTGDGVLVEFPSAHDAVEWARKVQQLAVVVQADGEGIAPSIALRISIHFADIITTEFDVFGDGVNVAARLQEHAAPGEIVLSEAAYDLVRGAVGADVRDLGYRHLKNLEKPVRIYALAAEAQGVAVPSLPREQQLPSIAVLPLWNQGGDPADDYFCDGVVEDITLSLAGLHELMVISRGSTLAYRGRQPDPREVGRALGVRYVMSGTVRRFEKLVRVSVELSDATTGARLWGEKADVPPGELFDLQDRISWRIVGGIAPNVRASEMRAAMRKRPESFTAYDYTLRGLHIINSLDMHTFLKARDFLNKAMAEDQNFAMPLAWAARWHSLYVGQGWSANPAEDRERAIDLASKAFELDPDNALALATFAHLKAYLFHDYDIALAYFERALAACPNHSLAWLLSAGTLSYIGQTKKAIEHAEQGLRLSPFDRGLYYYYMFLTLAYYADGQFEEAVKRGRLAISENPTYTATHRLFAASLAAIGNLSEARQIANAMLRLEPDFRLETYAVTRQPFRTPELRDRLMDHLRKAGFPQ
jgi:TolB-like protein/class 3 adenylate cyclase